MLRESGPKEAAIGLSFVLVKCSRSNLNALEFACACCW